jgi:hypothetical protein
MSLVEKWAREFNASQSAFLTLEQYLSIEAAA